MPWYNPASWFSRPCQAAPAADDDDDDNQPRFSRRAIDSSDVPMDDRLTIRIPYEQRIALDREARSRGFTLSEYIRIKVILGSSPSPINDQGVSMSNLFIAYDLNKPGQNYDAVRDAIKALGPWHQFQYSLFYVSTKVSAAEAYALVARSLDTNDRLTVIEANRAIVTNWDKPPIDEINAIWFAQ